MPSRTSQYDNNTSCHRNTIFENDAFHKLLIFNDNKDIQMLKIKVFIFLISIFFKYGLFDDEMENIVISNNVLEILNEKVIRGHFDESVYFLLMIFQFLGSTQWSG